jgi:hypothetical protein
LLPPALSFPPRKTRASSSKLQNTLEKQQPKNNLKQQPKNNLNPARVILGDGMALAAEDIPPRISAVSSATSFTDTVATNRQPDSEQTQQARSNAQRQPTRKLKSEHEIVLDCMTPTVDDLPPRRSGVVSPTTSINTIAAKRQPESKHDQKSSSKAKRQSTCNVKSEQERLLKCMTPAVDDLRPRRSGTSYTATCTDTDTVAAKWQPESKKDQQASSIATQQSTRNVNAEHVRTLDDMTPVVDDLPPLNSAVSCTDSSTEIETDTDIAASTIVNTNTVEGKQRPLSKRVQQSSSTAKTQPVVRDLPSRKTRASYTGAAAVTLSEPGTKLECEKPVENSTSVVGDLPSRRTRASYTGATSVTLSEAEAECEKPVENLTPAVGGLPSRSTRASYTGATSVTLSEPGIKLKKPVENSTSVVGNLPSRRTRASYSGATSVTLSEPGSKQKAECEKPVENLTPVVGGLPSRMTRASYNDVTCVTLSEPGTKLKKLVENSTSVVGSLPSQKTCALCSGATSVTLPEPGTKQKKPVENSTYVVGNLPSQRTRASYSGATSVTLPEAGSKLKAECEKTVENLTPVVGGLPCRRTRASYTGAPCVTLSEPGSMPDQQCRKRSFKPEHKSLLQNETSFSDDLVPRRSKAARNGPISSKQCSGSNLKQQPSRNHEQEREPLIENLAPPIYGLRSRQACASVPGATTEVYSTKEQSGDKVNHVPVRTLEDGGLLDNMAPVYEDLSPRKTRSSYFHSEIEPPRGRLDKQPSRNLRSENGKVSLGSLPAQALSEAVADSRQTNRKLEKHLSRKLRAEHATLKDNSMPVLGDLPPRKSRASSTDFVATTLHLPSKLSQQGRHANLEAKELPARKPEDEKQKGLASLGDFRSRGSRGQIEIGQPPNHKRKREHEVLLGDCPGKKPRTIVSNPKVTGGTAVSRDSGPLWINPGELREADIIVAETPAQISGPVVLFHVALVEEYRHLASRDVYEFVNFGPSLASTKAAIDFKLKELNLNMKKDHRDKDIEAERVDHFRSLKEFSRLADAERLEKIRESEEDVRQRLLADYHNRVKRVNPMRAEESTLISRPIRFEEGMEVGRRDKEPCCIGPDCTFCQKASAQDIHPKEEPLPRFRRFDMTQLDSIDASNDDVGASVARARRNRPARVGKRAASRLALSEMQHSLSFIEELNSTERTISHRLF